MAQRKSAQGVWIVEVEGQIIPESSEVRALRMAVTGHGSATFVKYGESYQGSVAAPAEPTAQPSSGTATAPADY